MEMRIEDELRESILNKNEIIEWLDEHIDQLESNPEYETKHETWYGMLNYAKHDRRLLELALNEINELKGRSQRY